MSSIKAYIEWENQSFFAGDEVRCIITFQNVLEQSSLSSGKTPKWIQKSEIGRRTRYLRNRIHQDIYTNQAGISSTKRWPLSVTGPSLVQLPNAKTIVSNAPNDSRQYNREHKRSLSILSSPSNADEGGLRNIPADLYLNTITREHMRLRSCKISDYYHSNPVVAPLHHFMETGHAKPRKTNQNPEILQTLERDLMEMPIEPPEGEFNILQIRSTGGSESAAQPKQSHAFMRQNPGARGQMLKERSIQSLNRKEQPLQDNLTSATKISSSGSGTLPRKQHTQLLASQLHTPRSSFDLYSISNDSADSLVSEYTTSTSFRDHGKMGQEQSSAHHSDGSCDHGLVKCMMGYVQLTGSFGIDESLVDPGPFEPLKRKGVIGGQGGGGVVGIDTLKSEEGILGNLGWSHLGQSIGSFLKGRGPSSIRDMKGIAGAKSVPILSTPQSIIFVDLYLSPGEKRSFFYGHKLPLNIPPSHRGRAFRASYQLLVGVQLPADSTTPNNLRYGNVPFKVLPSVDRSGRLREHNLMHPHIVLEDTSISYPLRRENLGFNHIRRKEGAIETPGKERFREHVRLLAVNSLGKQVPLAQASMGHQPFMPASRRQSEELPMRELIQFALRASIQAGLEKSSYQIQRSGRHIAVLTLAKPAFRLGELVSVILDFEQGKHLCYSVSAMLESNELIDSAIALRSTSSVHRATRRVHACCTQNALCAQRIIFSFTIPRNASPDFLTSGVKHRWNIHLEFVTRGSGEDQGGEEHLVENIAQDERGETQAAAQSLTCQGFEVLVPIIVYGSPSTVERGGYTDIIALKA